MKVDIYIIYILKQIKKQHSICFYVMKNES